MADTAETIDAPVAENVVSNAPVDKPTSEPTSVPEPSKDTDNNGPDEIVDIEVQSKSLLRRMAGMNPSKYPDFTPQPRADMSEYVYRKTARSRKMVMDQDRMLYNLQTIHGDLDKLDREVTQLQADCRRQRNERRYVVPHDGASFVSYNPNKYSLMDFDKRDYCRHQY